MEVEILSDLYILLFVNCGRYVSKSRLGLQQVVVIRKHVARLMFACMMQNTNQINVYVSISNKNQLENKSLIILYLVSIHKLGEINTHLFYKSIIHKNIKAQNP